MAFTQFSYDMDIISRLSDSPNVDDGLTAAQLKAKFDEGGKALKDYINNTLLPKVVERPVFAGMVKAEGETYVPAEAGKDYQQPIGDGDITHAMLAEDVTPAALGAAVPSIAKTAVLTSGGWSGKQQTVSVSGVAADNHIVVTPAGESYVAYIESMVRCITQVEGKLTFRCEDVPTGNLTVNILIVG